MATKPGASKLPPLEPIAALAGYAIPGADLPQVALVLEGVMEDIQRLRELDLPDDVEPITVLRVDPWEESR